MFPLAFYCLYKLSFVRKNSFSNKKELKLFNKPFEVAVLGAIITSRIRQKYQNLIYKQETEEVKLVKGCLDKLIDSNNLQKFVPLTKVCLIHN